MKSLALLSFPIRVPLSPSFMIASNIADHIRPIGLCWVGYSSSNSLLDSRMAASGCWKNTQWRFADMPAKRPELLGLASPTLS
jgi:hypothetical protein